MCRELKRPPVGVVVRRGVPAQMSTTSLDHGSKLRGPSPKALAQLNDVTLIFNQSINQLNWGSKLTKSSYKVRSTSEFRISYCKD
ncbi:hypothetical protein TNCV_3679691 [Trichonephila clavipes]|nr:hypothetical protein TNCV_3679691 [Trichonephila clavipes]